MLTLHTQAQEGFPHRRDQVTRIKVVFSHSYAPLKNDQYRQLLMKISISINFSGMVDRVSAEWSVSGQRNGRWIGSDMGGRPEAECYLDCRPPVGRRSIPRDCPVHVALDLPGRSGLRHAEWEWDRLNRSITRNRMRRYVIGPKVPTSKADNFNLS